MTLTSSHAAPSNLGDVLAHVRDLFRAAGNATPIMVGKKYLSDFGIGKPPRVLFVPDVDGAMGPPIEHGNPASDTHGCDVYVRAAETGDDIQRFRAAFALKGHVVDAVKRAASGRIEWRGKSGDDSPLVVDAHGADLTFGFAYQRDLRHGAIWALGPGTADGLPAPDESPPFDPLKPAALSSTDIAAAATTVPLAEL